MATQVQVRGAAAATQEARVLASREVDINTTAKRVCVHDGSTAGGIPHINYIDAQNQTYTYAVASGTDTITVNMAIAPNAYVAGQRYTFKAANTNTGTATLNVNSLGAKTIKKKDTVSGTLIVLDAGDIIRYGIYTVLYDGTDMQIELGSGQDGWKYENTVASITGVDVYRIINGIDAAGYNEIEIVAYNLNNSNDTTDLVLELGDAGGYETSGYLGYYTEVSGTTVASSTSTANIKLKNAWANADNSSFYAVLKRIGSTNVWVYNTEFANDSTSTMNARAGCTGTKTTSGATTSIQIRRVTSTGEFNSGSFTVRAR